MRERNPFLLRTSERIQSDEDFLNLFSPKVLEVILKDFANKDPWNQFFTFQSSPGGGKTTFLRLFTPTIVLKLCDLESSPEKPEGIYQSLEAIDAVSEFKPTLLGVYLSCAKNYSFLEELNIGEASKKRLFFSLLNSRIVLASLRQALALHRLSFPKDLSRISIRTPQDEFLPHDFPLDPNGMEIFDWARYLERNVYRSIDGFRMEHGDQPVGHDTLFALNLFSAENLKIDGKPLSKHFLLMFDDVHQLTIIQRNLLRDEILKKRPPIGVWIAERLEALSLEELLPMGTLPNRDYGFRINLERTWHNVRTFQKILANVADKRVQASSDTSMVNFAHYLHSGVEAESFEVEIKRALEVVSNRIETAYGSSEKYSNWITKISKSKSPLYSRLLQWKNLETIIERYEKRDQMALFTDMALSEDEYLERERTISEGDEEFLVHSEFAIPYYFGFKRLSYFSSSNLEQFLSVSGRLFEEIIAAKLIGRDGSISSKRQQEILASFANERWEALNKIPSGGKVKDFISSICKFAKGETHKPGYPYRGVTGIGLRNMDSSRLLDASAWKAKPDYRAIAEILSICISNNLLEVYVDRKQGSVGSDQLTLFYLNRWICLKFKLSLNYGGWRSISIEKLRNWVQPLN